MPAKKANNELDGILNIRINQQELDIFTKKSLRSTGKPYQLLIREIIAAFNVGRLRIIPTDAQQKGELYDIE